MDRRAFLNLLILAGAGVLLPSCRREQPTSVSGEIPVGFRNLVKNLDAQPSLDMFLGAKEFVPGANRIPFAIIDDNGKPIEATKVSMYVALDEKAGPARAARFREFQNGSLHTHGEGSESASPFESAGFYEADADLSSAGFWHVMAVTQQDPRRVGFAALEVSSDSRVPAVGDPALPVDTPTNADSKGAAYVCTREPPCPMHSVSLGDALRARKPVVFVVATPRFCRSRLCGPVVDEVQSASTGWDERVEFIHAEVYTDEEAKSASPSMLTWNLDSEPWVFVIDSSGTVKARFEGPVVSSQVQQAIDRAI